MNTTKETVPVQQTPEQLLRGLEFQLGARRARREKPDGARVVKLIAGIALIVVGAFVALLVLEHLLRDMRASERPSGSGTVVFGQP